MDLLRDMALFVEVARALSFTKASQRLDLPTSTVSRRVRALEASLKIRLLHRSTRAVELTDAGAIYLQRCAAIVDEARMAHENIRELATLPRGHLRVSMTGDFGPIFFAPFLVQFRKIHPDITFELDLSPRRVDLTSEPFDLALRIGSLEESSLIARRLALLRVALYAAPSYVELRGSPRRPEDLGRHDTIAITRGADAAFWTLSNDKEDRRVPLKSPFTANSLGMIRMLAISGAGIGVLDEAMVRQDVKLGRLVRVLPQWTHDRVPVHAVTTSRLIPAKTRVLIDFLAKQLADMNHP